MLLIIDTNTQTLTLWENEQCVCQYNVSTAAKGLGEHVGSEQTPRGWHKIRAKIGAGCSINTVFVERRPTGEAYSWNLRQQYPERDWILTRILWLTGLEVGKNRMGTVDTLRRCIYIHGTPDDCTLTSPGSRGCIRMRNNDVIKLFDSVSVGDRVWIGPGLPEYR
ncbi:MAG: peptidase [Coxiella sp. RIFCSPHIGHO2_12_FULL_44_14]|nr:MAG: peptidase [Coxiella sp. RIFCSPHIGHO2_12_FULL_44_14]